MVMSFLVESQIVDLYNASNRPEVSNWYLYPISNKNIIKTQIGEIVDVGPFEGANVPESQRSWHPELKARFHATICICCSIYD